MPSSLAVLRLMMTLYSVAYSAAKSPGGIPFKIWSTNLAASLAIAADEIRASRKSQDRKGAQPHRSCDAARPCRRGDRIISLQDRLLLRLLRSPLGTGVRRPGSSGHVRSCGLIGSDLPRLRSPFFCGLLTQLCRSY